MKSINNWSSFQPQRTNIVLSKQVQNKIIIILQQYWNYLSRSRRCYHNEEESLKSERELASNLELFRSFLYAHYLNSNYVPKQMPSLIDITPDYNIQSPAPPLITPITHAQLSNQTNHTQKTPPFFKWKLSFSLQPLRDPQQKNKNKTTVRTKIPEYVCHFFLFFFYFFFFFSFFDNQFIPCSLMCMNRPNYSMPEMPAPTTTMNTIELNSTTTSSTTTRDLEKQQPLQPHQEKQIAGRTPSLYKILISLNLFSILLLGLIYYFIEFHPNFSTNLNELLYKMEKCNDL